jgi:hypothetical protein
MQSRMGQTLIYTGYCLYSQKSWHPELKCRVYGHTFSWRHHQGVPLGCPNCRKLLRAETPKDASALWMYLHRNGFDLESYLRYHKQHADTNGELHCEICGGVGRQRLCGDHHHSGNQDDPIYRRGLLCRWCNDLIGRIENGAPTSFVKMHPKYSEYLRYWALVLDGRLRRTA